MVSVNHSNKKVRSLHEVLSQMVPESVVVPFAESKSSASFAALALHRDRIVIFPPVTGPSVERAFFRVSSEKQRKHEEKLQELENASTIERIQTAARQQREAEGKEQVPPAQATKAGGAQRESQREGQPESRPDEPPTFAPGPRPGSYVVKGASTKIQSLFNDLLNDSDEDESVGIPFDLDLLAADMASSSAASSEIITEADTGAAEINPLGIATLATCIELETADFSGYLMVAMGTNCNIGAEFFSQLRERLTVFLIDHSDVPDTSERNLVLRVRPVPNEEWALESTRSLRRFIHHLNEVAMAFFSDQDIEAKFGDSIDKDMVSVALSQIRGDKVVECNLYIYMPINNKYLLYTRRGSKFYQNQRERLQGHGVSELHLQKDEVPDFVRYRTQTIVEDKVEKFEVESRVSPDTVADFATDEALSDATPASHGAAKPVTPATKIRKKPVS